MNSFKILYLAISIGSIVACAPIKPYAQNPFNPTAKLAQTIGKEGAISNSAGFKAAGVGLAATETSVPGAIPSGVGVGIAAAMLLGSGDSTPLNVARNANFLEVSMPLSYATDESDAQVKMGKLIETAIFKALESDYKVKVEEYDDTYLFGKVLRPRWIRVNGPKCENWSCQIIAPISTANALQWEGIMKKISPPNEAGFYAYDMSLSNIRSIGLVKITKEYEKSDHRVVEGVELDGFDYNEFFKHISENLPDWVLFKIYRDGKGVYSLKKGIDLSIQP
ncbi:hypothetical protein [Methylovulum psychrotolerans]|uniref:Lipoprotein n=1 Tax=Methylovulum psychrotolerans TaxID=1704499 RepID=A0A2S5CIM5_9GAMM|nr:hypothetical protein [Methylovulum psychrotolerans]POZ50654.1 hypothetical protein AADEFJLK_03551 [Methylovulum psychrotolerans]